MSLELNIDGLVGPTHNYAGLSTGNLASGRNKGARSNPKMAALQGLGKMRTLMNLGIPQAVMPPHERPFIPLLRQLGYTGRDSVIVEAAWKDAPTLMANISSASSMWTANAATVSPSADCADAKLHITPANLLSMPHRAIEAQMSARILRRIFSDKAKFTVHDPLPAYRLFSDEGAANHNRLSKRHGTAALEIFVHGHEALRDASTPTRLPARQTLEAGQTIARTHGLSSQQVLHIAQSPQAIDGGAFHNDVVCVTNGPVMMFHEHAFDDVEAIKTDILRRSEPLGFTPYFIMARAKDMTLEDAITSYLFNSQLVTTADGKMILILPVAAKETPSAYAFAQNCVAEDNPINGLIFVNLRQSMRNGGGPACLRLRIAMTDDELAAMHQGVLLDEPKIQQLEQWVETHYRDRLDPSDLGDPNLLRESQTALDALTQVLDLGSLYDFQHDSREREKA